MASSHKFSFYLLDPTSGSSSTDDSFVSTKSTAYAVQQGGLRSADPNGNEWTADALSNIVMRQTAAIPQSQKVAFRSTGLLTHFKSAPLVGHITVAPGTQLTFTEGGANNILWTYDDLDGDPQTGWAVKIFDQFTYEASSFSPDNSKPLWQSTGSDASTSVSLNSALPSVEGNTVANTGFVDGNVYYVGVKVSKDHNKKPFWSAWRFQQFTVFIDQPKPPLISVFTNSSNASNTLVLQSADNLLGDNNGGMRYNTGDWQATTFDQTASAGGAVSTTQFGHMATANTNVLTAGKTITSLAVGASGYIATVGGISAGLGVGQTFTVSGKSGSLSSAIGFPVNGTFWVTIGSEKLLVANKMDGAASKPDTFSIVARGYKGTTAASHSQWSPVIIGTQQDIYAGSSGELVYTYDITVYGKPVAHHGVTRWYPDANSTTRNSATEITVTQAIDPNNHNENTWFWVNDGGNTIKSGMKVYINYTAYKLSLPPTIQNNTWTRTDPNLLGHFAKNGASGPGLTAASNRNIEPVVVKSVETVTTTTKSAVYAGKVTGTFSGGKNSPLRHIDIHINGDGKNFVSKIKKGTKLTIFGSNGGFSAIVKSDISLQSVSQVGSWFWAWDKVTIPINAVTHCKPFKVIDNTGNYFTIPDGASINFTGQYSHNTKKITVTHPFGQGQFAGMVLQKGDFITVPNTQVAHVPGHTVTGQTTYTQTSQQVAQTQKLEFTVAPLQSATASPHSYRNVAIPSATATPYYTSLTVSVPSLYCTFANGATTMSAINNSDAATLFPNMKITGTGIQSGTTITSVQITPTGNTIGLSLATTASSGAGGNQITGVVSSNQYSSPLPYSVSMAGVPDGTTITSNSSSSGGVFTINLSTTATVPVASWSGTTPVYATGYTQATFLAPSSYIIPAGSNTIPITPTVVNFNYPVQCPVRIDYPSLYGDNALLVDPTQNGTAEVSLVKTVNRPWTSTNNVPIIAGQRYGLAAFTSKVSGSGTPAFTPYIDWYNEVGDLISSTTGRHSVATPYFTGNLTLGSAIITNPSTIAGVKIGNTVSGWGIPSGATITALSPLTMSANATITQSNVTISNSNALVVGAPITFTGTTSTSSNVVSSVSTTTGMALGQYVYGYGIPSGTTITNVSSGQITLSNTPTAAATETMRVASTGIPIGEVGNTLDYSPTSKWGAGWTPNGVTGTAPSAHTVASIASFSLSSGSIGTYTVTGGTTIQLSAGATITDSNGFSTTLTQTASAGSTTLTVRFNAQPSGGNVGLFIAATRAVPRFQWVGGNASDVYGLSSVMFKALTANLPNSNYTALNTQLDTLAVPVATNNYSESAVVLSHSTTKTNGAETLYLFDPAMDYGTREFNLGNNSQILWTKLATAISSGATAISLYDTTGLASGGTIVVGYNTPIAETLTIAQGWAGSNPVILDPTTPVYNNHPIGDTVYGTTIALASVAIQSQASGTPVAVFNWNTDGWINTPLASYTLTVQRSEDNGKSWTTLRNGGNLTVESHGIATITDFEMTPGATQLYRSWATWISPSKQSWQGEATPALTAPVMANTQWWISSTSNPALRYPLLVQNAFSETQKHPNGVLYPLGSRYPITIGGVVNGRDGSIEVIWTDITNWQNFLDFLRLGEVYVLLSPVENKKFYIFINNDVTWENNSGAQPWRKVTIPYVETAPPNYGYTFGK